ncbi:hypothetical protein P3T36_004730 [Kitasatospora sp. MAP12-15]|uniref:hypothetical protein n=1 Tax=unclassified Kitasatospora TaxID=2633591 RepID=UPI002475796A|nr:hypothetical protein [Kitasatospora sp. MAP12-44]MDH6110338.1 hypothetical protein [Kitasatospora sp. MAP12-44]
MRQNSSVSPVNTTPAARVLVPLLIALFAVAALLAGTGSLGGALSPSASVTRPLADVGWNSTPADPTTPAPTSAP